MTTCWACEAELAPQWKFCIRCGVPVEAESVSSVKEAAPTVIGPLGVFGLILAGVAGVLGLVVVVVLVLHYT